MTFYQLSLEGILRRFLYHATRLQLHLTVAGCGKKLADLPNTRVLLDNSILHLGVLHRTVGVLSRPLAFGNSHFQAEIPHLTTKEFAKKDLWLSEQQQFLPAIARLGELGKLTLFTSTELQRETWTHPMSEYLGSIYANSLFSGDWIQSLTSPAEKRPSRVMRAYDWTTEEQRDFFRTIKDKQFREFSKLIDAKHIADVFHVWTAYKSECHAFLTVDRKLINIITTLKSQGKLNWLTTQVQSPQQFAKIIGARAIRVGQLMYLNPVVPIFDTHPRT